jgi:hypothetical protein
LQDQAEAMTLLKSGWPLPRPRPRCRLVKHYPGVQGVIKPAAARPSTHGGSTIAVASLALRRRSTRRFWHDRRYYSDAAPEAKFPGRRGVRRGGDERRGIAVLTAASGDGGPRGAPPRPKLSMMIMRPP